jgi:hypothetical protein
MGENHNCIPSYGESFSQWLSAECMIQFVDHMEICIYQVFRVQADWTFILLLELPAKELPPAKKNSAVWYHVLRSLVSLHNDHHVFMT